MPEALQNRVRSLTKAKGESVLAEASLLEGVKRADFDAVLKVAPGRSYEDRIGWSLVMASSLAQQDLDFHCDCSGLFGALDPACYIGMIYEAIKGNDWNSAYEATGAAVEVTYEDEKQLATLKGQLVHEQNLDWDAQNALMVCLIKCAMSRTKSSFVGSGLSSKKPTPASAVPDKQASSGDSQKPIQKR